MNQKRAPYMTGFKEERVGIKQGQVETISNLQLEIDEHEDVCVCVRERG